MLKIAYGGCPGLSVVMLVQLTAEMCTAAENRKNTKNPYSRSLKVIDVDATEKHVTSACYEDRFSSINVLQGCFYAFSKCHFIQGFLALFLKSNQPYIPRGIYQSSTGLSG